MAKIRPQGIESHQEGTMSDRTKDEALIAEWLNTLNYKAERPVWLTGRNPDFWATSTDASAASLWVEVKSIDEDDSTATLARFNSIVRGTTIPPGLHGEAILSIESNAIEQSVRWVLKAFTQYAPQFAGQKITLAFVQQDRDGRSTRRVERTGVKREILWVRGDPQAGMRPPANVLSGGLEEVTVRYPDGTERVGKAYEFFDWNAPTQCSLAAHLDPDRRALDHIVSTSSGDSGHMRQRVINALEDANDQLRRANRSSEAPGIVAVVLKGPFPDDFSVQTACYGHIMVPIRLHEDGSVEHGTQRHDSNEQKAVFRRDKNRHISAVVVVSDDKSAKYYPNPFAHRAIPDDAPVFSGAERADVKFE